MKKTLLLLCLFAIGSQLKGQNVVYINDSTLSVGAKIYTEVPKELSSKISVQDKKEVITYTPEEILGFVKSGITYESRYIELNGKGKYYFLEIIARDETMTLYYLLTKELECYFLQLDKDPLLLLDKDAKQYYQYLIKKTSHFSDVPIKQMGKKGLSRYHLKNEFRVSETGNQNLLRKFKWGVFINTGVSILPAKEQIHLNSNDEHLSGGIFIDIPVRYGFSIHPSLSVMKDAYYAESPLDHEDIFINDITLNRTALHLPIMLRYSLININKKCIPYFEAGPYAGYSFRTKARQRNREKHNNNLYPVEYTNLKTQPFIYGFGSGLGYELNIVKNHTFYAGLNYSYITSGLKNHWSHQLFFSLSVNL